MRQVKYLIQEAKENTNTTDVEAITNQLCVRLLNRIQDYIKAFLFTQNTESKIFRAQSEFTLTPGAAIYQLPFNIYAKNSINAVFYKLGNSYSPLRQIAEKSKGSYSGYFLSDNNIIFNPAPTAPYEIFLSYTKKIPSVGLSYGKIQTVNANTSIVLESGFLDMTGVDDFFTVVDKCGAVIVLNVPISQTGNTILVTNTLGILAGMYVVPGTYATTHSQLPDEFESSIIGALEVLINARMSSVDLPVSKSMSDEMIAMIGDMFAENTTDDFMPPVVEFQEWV